MGLGDFEGFPAGRAHRGLPPFIFVRRNTFRPITFIFVRRNTFAGGGSDGGEVFMQVHVRPVLRHPRKLRPGRVGVVLAAATKAVVEFQAGVDEPNADERIHAVQRPEQVVLHNGRERKISG